MDKAKLTLSILPMKLAVCRLERDSTIPVWATDNTFFSITRTDDELSIVCPENKVPQGVISEKNWRAFKVMGPLDFSLTGILASLANALAEAKISIIALSTFETDYILVKNKDLEKAVKALSTFCNVQD
jgi:uncharacterized protein